MIVSPMLRREPNARYYTLIQTPNNTESLLEDHQWRNSMIFSGVVLFSTLCSAAAAKWFIKQYHLATYSQIVGIYGGLFARPTYYG